MVITKNVKSLKNEIEKLIDSRYFYIRQLGESCFKNNGYYLFKAADTRIYDRKLRAFDVNIKASEIYVQDSYLITYDDEVLTILTFDNRFKFKKIREIRTHYLLFCIKTQSISKEARFIMYNMLLSLTVQKVKMIDKFLEDIMIFLNVENVSSMYIKDGLLYCTYHNLNTKVYDATLSTETDYDLTNIDEPPKIGNKLAFEDLTINVLENKLEIDYVKKSYIEVIEIPDIKQVYCNDNNLFVLTDSNVKILAFRDNC